MKIEANCRTTAMGIMPHTDIEDAFKVTLSLDIPCWPQLPRISFYQDMFAQTSQNFPGIAVDVENHRLDFSTDRFQEELPDYSLKMGQAETFTLTGKYAEVYEQFLCANLSDYHAIRGQIAGPISLGFNVLDETRKPIIYNDEVRVLLFDFIKKKLNVQYRELRERNSNAFVWLDEPGLIYVFSAMYGYNDLQAKEDYSKLLQGIEGPIGLHLCPNVNLPYLLQLGVDILSFDAYQLEFMPAEYARAAADFIRNGGIICWGITPTSATVLAEETPQTLAGRLISYWNTISGISGLSQEEIAGQALVAPTKCCIKELDFFSTQDTSIQKKGQDLQETDTEVESVNHSFSYLREISGILRNTYGIYD